MCFLQTRHYDRLNWRRTKSLTFYIFNDFAVEIFNKKIQERNEHQRADDHDEFSGGEVGK